MKQLYLVCLSIFFASFSYSQDLIRTSPIKVAEDAGNHHPQIEVLGDNRVGITWTDPSEKAIYFAKHNGVDGFGEPIRLNPEGLDVQSYTWSGPDMALEGDNIYVVFRSHGHETGGIYMVKSSDNGATFGDTVRVDHLSEGFGQFPDIAVLDDIVYVAFMGHDDGGINPAYVVSRSTDGGATFEDEVLAAALLPGESCDCCQPEIVVNDDVLIVFFRNNDEDIRDVKGVKSYNDGVSFEDWISVDDHNWFIEACPSSGPDARFMTEDKVAAAYKTEVGGTSKVFLNIYDLTANTSLELIEVYASEALEVSLNYPQLAYGNNTLGIVWEDSKTGTGLDVYFNYSDADDINFDPDNAINLTEEVSAQSKPDIAIRYGIFQVVYANSIDGDLYYLQIGEPNAIVPNEISDLFDVYFSELDQQIIIESKDIKPTDILVSDMGGRILLQESMHSTQYKVDTQSWEKGVYIVTLKSREISYSTRIVR